MLAQRQAVTLIDLQGLDLIHERGEVVIKHDEGTGIAHYGDFGIPRQETADACGVVGFHVLHDEVIGTAAIERSGDVVQPFLGEANVHGVQNGGLFVQNYIRVICHAVGYDVLAFKQVDVVVIDPCVNDIIAMVHSLNSFLLCLYDGSIIHERSDVVNNNYYH